MSLIWKLPSEPPNTDAIERMRQYFPKPPESMPEAWFMGHDLYFFDDLDRNTTTERLCHALSAIKVGITAFPESPYVALWKAWFRYLLPDLILRANAPDNFNDFRKNILAKTIIAFMSVYPGEITEEYPGFRLDVVSALGTRAIPYPLAREVSGEGSDNNRLFIDLWDASDIIQHYGFCSFEEVNSSILFCMKYLTSSEVANWALSLFKIESPQWYLQLLFSLTQWRKLLTLVETGTGEEGQLQKLIEASGMLNEAWVPPFKSFDEFISPTKVQAFEQVIAEHLTFDLLRVWKAEILKALSVSTYNLEHDGYLTTLFGENAQACEAILFPTLRS